MDSINSRCSCVSSSSSCKRSNSSLGDSSWICLFLISMFPLDSLGLIWGYTGGRKCATNRFWTIAANKPVGGKTTCGAVRRLHQELCQTVKFVRMTMYPKERGRTAGRACMWCASTVTTINLFIPCNVITTCGMGEHRQKMRFTVRLWESMPGSGFSFTLDYRGVRLELPPTNSYTLISIVTIRDN